MNYYNELESLIKRNEINKKVRILEENKNVLENYWKIGKLLVKAQGGETRAKYRNKLIKEWAQEFTKKYGKGYSTSNLKYMRQFYLIFQKGHPVGDQLTWSHYRLLLPIKEENKRNYYINLCTNHNLSKRELAKELKNNSYGRLLNKPNKIEIETPHQTPFLIENIKNPILIELKEEQKILTEQDLEIAILSQLQNFLKELGQGFALIDNQYKINHNNKNYFIDILLFNYKINYFFVVELKLRELKKEDKAQIEFYMQLINQKLKEPFHNKTIGIIIPKKQDKFIANFVETEEIIALTYQINKK